MKSLKLFYDKNNVMDIYIGGNGSCEYVDGDASLMQDIKFELESNLGEWYLGTGFGTKYFTDEEDGLLDKKSTIDDFSVEVLKVVNKHDGVLSSNISDVEQNDRTLYLIVNVKTTKGEEFQIKINPLNGGFDLEEV